MPSLSAERIEQDIDSLANFGTRHTLRYTISKTRVSLVRKETYRHNAMGMASLA